MEQGVRRRVEDRLRFLVHKARKRAKVSRYRYLILQEWAQTEERYCKDLNLVIGVRRELEKLTACDLKEVFINVDALAQLSATMVQLLRGLIANFHTRNTMIGQSIGQLCPFFKIYSQYCNGYTYAEERIKEMRRENSKFESYLSEREGTSEFCGLSLQSLLIKPVQRVPKYVLFLKDYLKKLPDNHADKGQILKTMQKYVRVNAHNDNVMEVSISNAVLFSLESRFGKILESRRHFVERRCRFTLFFYIPFRINLYLFNDMILTTRDLRDGIEEKHSFMYLNSESYYYLIPSGKYFKHYLFISGENTCSTIQAISDVDRKGFEQTFRKVIEELKSKRNSQQQSRLSRTQIRSIAAERRYNRKGFTVRYVVEFESETHRIRRDYGVSDFVNLEEELARDGVSQERVPLVLSSSLMEFYDIKKNKSQIMEFRKIAFMEFLNRLFKLPEMDKKEFMEKYLGLLRLPLALVMEEPLQSDKQILETYSMIKAVRPQHLLSFYEVNRKKGIGELKSDRRKTLQVQVFQDSPQPLPVKVEIDHLTTAQMLVKLVCKELNINQSRDLAIYHEEEGTRRAVDRDEIVCDLLKEVGTEGCFSFISDIFFSRNSRLVLSKSIVLSNYCEKTLFESEKSNGRKRILAEIVFRQLSEGLLDRATMESKIRLTALQLYYRNPIVMASLRASELDDSLIARLLPEYQPRQHLNQLLKEIETIKLTKKNENDLLERILKSVGYQIDIYFKGVWHLVVNDVKSEGEAARIRVGVSGIEVYLGGRSLTMSYSALELRCCPRSLYLDNFKDQSHSHEGVISYRFDTTFPFESYDCVCQHMLLYNSFAQRLL